MRLLRVRRSLCAARQVYDSWHSGVRSTRQAVMQTVMQTVMQAGCHLRMCELAPDV
jgi:hypothetical protein